MIEVEGGKVRVCELSFDGVKVANCKGSLVEGIEVGLTEGSFGVEEGLVEGDFVVVLVVALLVGDELDGT